MTPDMRRLCLAVAKVRWNDPDTRDADWTDEALANFECETIVRAVLTVLREPSESIMEAGGRRIDGSSPYGMLTDVAEGEAREIFTVMIDHILTA